jgi:hypothetical protein
VGLTRADFTVGSSAGPSATNASAAIVSATTQAASNAIADDTFISGVVGPTLFAGGSKIVSFFVDLRLPSSNEGWDSRVKTTAGHCGAIIALGTGRGVTLVAFGCGVATAAARASIDIVGGAGTDGGGAATADGGGAGGVGAEGTGVGVTDAISSVILRI